MCELVNYQQIFEEGCSKFYIFVGGDPKALAPYWDKVLASLKKSLYQCYVCSVRHSIDNVLEHIRAVTTIHNFLFALYLLIKSTTYLRCIFYHFLHAHFNFFFARSLLCRLQVAHIYTKLVKKKIQGSNV